MHSTRKRIFISSSLRVKDSNEFWLSLFLLPHPSKKGEVDHHLEWPLLLSQTLRNHSKVASLMMQSSRKDFLTSTSLAATSSQKVRIPQFVNFWPVCLEKVDQLWSVFGSWTLTPFVLLSKFKSYEVHWMDLDIRSLSTAISRNLLKATLLMAAQSQLE